RANPSPPRGAGQSPPNPPNQITLSPSRQHPVLISHRGRSKEEEGEKMGGGMEVNKNRWIEEWNAGRENLEFNFRWSRRSLAVVGLFGLAVPILVYKGIVREFHMQDEDAGRPYRKFL
ncbi:unnamed protein product, partial [Urochloa humidicola]